MFAKVLCVLGIALIIAINAEQEGEEFGSHCRLGDAKVVQRDWNGIRRACNSHLKINLVKATLLHVVDKHPEAKTLFQNVRIDDPDSGEFKAQCLRIFNHVDLLVNLLHDKDLLRVESAHLGLQHAARPGVLGRYFKTFISYATNFLSQYDYRIHIVTWESCLSDMLKEVFEAIPN